jgi:hypothetical protein
VRALDSVFMFHAPGLIFGDTGGVGSHFYVLRSRSHFWRYRERLVMFSCFALQDSFSAVSKVSVSFSYFAHSNSLWTVPRALDPVFMF